MMLSRPSSLSVLAQCGRVLVLYGLYLRDIALDIGDVGTDQPQLLQDQVCGFVCHN